MNEYTIVVNFSKRATYFKDNIEPLITGDYNSTKFKFEFDREDGVKIFKLKNPNGEAVALEEIANNEIILKGEDEQGRTCSLFNVDGEYTFEISLYDSQEKNSKLTSVSNTFTVHPEQVPIDSEIVTPQLPIFDQLFSHVQEELEEMEEATEHLVEANTEAERIVSEFESNVEQYTEDFNTNAAEKTNAVNQIKSDVETLVNGFDSNVTAKTTQFNSNASEKLSNYNSNAESKLNEYNSNAESKLSDYNSNAIQKTTEFNTNAQEKTDEFNANKEKLQQELERYKLIENALPHITGTGTELTLNNTANAPMSMVLNPNTSQETTTGKNLCNPTTIVGGACNTSGVYDGGYSVSAFSNTNGVISFTTSYSYGGFVSDYIEIEPNKQYVVSYKVISAENNLYNFYCFYDENKSGLARNAGTAPADAKYLRMYVGLSGTGTSATITDIQVEQNSSATSYEPYTGSIPAPNPDYPQDIHVVSGDNTLKVIGQNIWDEEWEQGYYNSTGGKENATNAIRSKNFIKVQPNAQYYIYNGTDNNGRVNFYDKDKNFISTSSSHNQIKTTPNNCYYILFSTGTSYGGTYLHNICINVSNANVNGTYEPHEEQVVNIPLGDLEYCKIPNSDYKDEFYKATSDKNKLPNAENKTETVNNRELVSNNGIYTITGSGGASFSILELTEPYMIKENDYLHLFNNVQTSSVEILAYDNSNTRIFDIAFGTINNIISLNDYAGSTIKNIRFWVNVNATAPIIKASPMIINNISTATDYEPYGNGKWYLKKNIGKVVLDGTETIRKESYGGNNFYYKIIMSNKAYVNNNINIENLSSHFISVRNTTTYWNNGKFTISSSGDLIIIDMNFEDVASLKTWLASNMPKFDYVLETPQYILLANNLQEALNTLESKLLAYKGQTNISQVNDDLPFEIVASALKDLSNL